MVPVPKELDKRTLWKAELRADQVTHLSEDDKIKIRLMLSAVVDAIAAEYKVGREFENGLRTATR